MEKFFKCVGLFFDVILPVAMIVFCLVVGTIILIVFDLLLTPLTVFYYAVAVVSGLIAVILNRQNKIIEQIEQEEQNEEK